MTCQTLVVGQSKNDLKKLNTLFWSGNYREVILNYAELYNQDRKNEDINFKYGTCLLFESDSISKQEKAIGHLRFACAKEGSLAEYHFFLGRALHRFGDFEGALNHFALYKTKKNKTSVELNAELYINYCTESLKLNELTQASLIKIGSIVPTQLGKSYSLNQIELTGKFFNSIEFQTKLDKKKNYEPLIFKSDNATMRFFASYGEKDEENKDIYLVTGSFDNKKIERLSSKINTRFDEDYPIFDEKTNYLYFSSLGHNSSGGYDIFRSKYDSLSQEFETPENLGKGISTPYDDFLFMYNPLNNRAFISSTKLSLSGGISIFQGVVNFTDYSIQLPVTVNIQFKNGDNNSMKLKSIQIKNLANDSIIQTLNPVASNNFEMKLSPGTYSYTIQISGSKDIFEAKIDIPNDQQKIIQTVEYSLNDLNTEIVAITNIIENVSSEVVLALNKTKEGKSNIQSSKLLDEQNEKEVLEKLGMESFSKIEVIDAISDKIIELELAQKENLDLINKLNAAIVHNKSYYQQLQHEIDSINPSLSDFTNIEKLEKLKYIENISAEQAEVAKQTIWLQQLNDSIRNTQKLNETNYRLVQKLGEEIIDLTQQENQIEAYQKIIQNHQQYLALNAETAFETIYNDLLNIELELSRIDKKVIVLMNEKTKFQDELTETEIKLRNVTNKERTELEKSKMNFEQKLASNEKQITRLKLDKSELIILKTDKELKRNILAAVIKEDYEEPTNYEDAVKNYFDSKLNQDSKSEEIAQKIKQIEENLTPEEIAYSKASKLYAIKIESLYNSDNDKTQKIAIEQEYSNTLKQLIEKGEDSASFISFLNEKLQESTSKLQAMKLDEKQQEDNNQIAKSNGKQADPGEVIEKESISENQIAKSDGKQANPAEVIEKESVTENQIVKSDGKQANPTEVIEKGSVTENQIAKSDGKQTNPDVVIEKEIVTENQIVKSVLSEKLPQNLESLVGQDVNDLSKNLKEIETQKSVIYTELQTNNPTISFLSIEKLRYNLEILQDRNSIITQLLEEEKVKVDQSKNKKEKSILNTKITELDIELTENTNLINQIKQEIEKEGEIQITLEKKSTINYLEEKKQLEITASQSYKNFVIALVDFEKTETKFEKTKDTINQIKAAIDREINNIVTNPNNVTHKKNVELLTIALQKQLKEKKNLTSGMLEQKNEILNIESGNKEIINEMRFLVVNKTEPLVKTISTPKNENIPLTGFDINQKKESNYNSSNPIPLNVKAPKGLVYRVQVGAFRKPIPQNLYSSFNPVSGELSPNGLTLYMAGYFNNAKNAVTARKQIQQLGYSDAFVVAYCDGEKITLGEARILESKGECIPLNSTNFILEIANNTKEALKEQKSIETKPSNQNTTSNEPLLQASQKLFYTVQIAVYNQLINEKVKFPALNEIATTKISTGQIRYSTGRFSDLNSAKERKDKAIQSGIKDAFIVAYFKGDRITIAAAKDLLSQYGDSILFSNPTQEVFHSEELAYQSSDKKYFAQDEVKATPIYHRYQSNDEFERFPIEKLAYFNQYGLFQYNPDSKKIESLSFKIENDLESSLKLSGYLSSLTYNPTYFSTDINESISGDLADFILRSHSIQRINSKENLQIEFEKSLILKENYTNLLKDTFQLNIKPHE